MAGARLLIGYDGSNDADGAIRAAGRLLPGSEAVVVHVHDPTIELERAALARIALPDSVIAASMHDYEDAAEIASRGRTVAAEVGLQASSVVRPSASASRGLCEAATERAADVVVCGSRGRGGLARTYLGSTASSLLHHSPCPVLVVPTAEHDLTGPIVIGFDASDGARAAVRTAAKLFPGRSAVVMHVWASPVRRSYVGSALLATPMQAVSETAGDLDETFAAEAHDVADEGAALAREQGLDATARVVEGPRGWRGVTAAAKTERAALLVVGCRGRGAVAATVLGSVSFGVVHHAELPVLVSRGQ